MKGKERSPVKSKRSRALEEPVRERAGGGGHPSSNSSNKKMGASSAGGGGGNASGKAEGAAVRRSLNSEKRVESRDFEGHPSSRASTNHSYGNAGPSSGTKNHATTLTPEPSSRVNPRGERGQSSESEYKTLKISELGSQLSDEAVEDGLFHEFKKFGDVSVKISRIADERVAFVNFRRPEDARAAKHARGKLVLYDRPLRIEAVYINRRRSRSPIEKEPYLGAALAGVQGHRHPHAQRSLSPPGLGYRDYRLQQLALGRLPPPPPPPLPRDLERERDFLFYDNRVRPAYNLDRTAFREEEISPEDDQRANRTLFIGNLDITVTENDLRRAFDRFGVITEVDIKRPTRGQTSTYGFLKFENLDMAHRAKIAMSARVIGRNSIKIGYGKATPTTRLWVGGLGPWVPLAALAREFDRFGTIRTIDYRKGDSWAYIQYESLDAAQAACTHMRGFPLGGPDRRLRVDFADTEHRYQQPYLQPLPLPHYDLVGDGFAHRAPETLRRRDPTPPPLHYRERELFPGNDWGIPAIRDRNRSAYEQLDYIERERRRENWSAERERELQNRDQARKRRLPEEGRHFDRSPGSDRSRKRHCISPDHSPGGSSRDGGRYSDTERGNRNERLSLDRDKRSSLERVNDKFERKPSNSIERERERKHRTIECKSPVKKEDRGETVAVLKSPQKQESTQKLSLAWQGMLLLKNSNFPSNMHLLEGDLSVARNLLIDGTTRGKVAQLKITQRLRLDQPKLDEVTRRIKVAGPNGYAVLLAVPGNDGCSSVMEQATSTQRPLKNLVSYLKQKQAAGVISLPVGGSKDKDNTGVLHAFPPCDFSQKFLDSAAKALAKSEEDYLVMIIVRGAS
ncbi:RNA-binding protein 15 [Latimeria chalumnae]|uniref:RNA-binding protein 15 n=1 Tax=Latimeria chalumnae TaxID=7897 RepID=H3BG89_LATCH|nr:PREDICTED: putative RNA-binding protein 15 [Latimeria chalumnae]|eukprot:XP_005989290.1 PREDICTED: putative RNA-binding protein 15 [Latimeria chalumnae]